MTTKLSFKHCLVLVLIMICFICFSRASICFAANGLDGLGGNSQTTNSNQNYSSKNNNNAVAGYLKDRAPVTQENMKSANQLAGPIASAIGTATGFILIIVSSLIFFITALDLLYIGVPPLRNILNPVGASPQPQPVVASPQPQAQVRKWVSDEAIAAVALANPQASGSPIGGSPLVGAGATAPSQSTKSVVFTYLKKRMFFIIVFTVCSIVLMSSVLTDCGINLSQLLLKILMHLNGSIANVNI